MGIRQAATIDRAGRRMERGIAFSSNRGTPPGAIKRRLGTVPAASVDMIGIDARDLWKLPAGAGQFAGWPKWSTGDARVVFYEIPVANRSKPRLLGAQATIESNIVSVDVATSTHQRRVNYF